MASTCFLFSYLTQYHTYSLYDEANSRLKSKYGPRVLMTRQDLRPFNIQFDTNICFFLTGRASIRVNEASHEGSLY